MKIRHTYSPIFAAKRSQRNKKRRTSREIMEDLIRCKSSNVWGYVFDNPDGESIGTLYVQFKSISGGPGDVYCYYQVPLSIYRKLLSAPSKGHAFWRYIRNNFRYSKLTGDKRGKLPNAVA